MPLLSSSVSSNHWGYIAGFDLLNAGQQQALDDMQSDARAAGMDVERIFTTWAELNPEDGVYDLNEFEEQLQANFNAGSKTYVSVTTIDSSGVDDVPDRFKDDNSGTGLSTSWSSDEMLGDYNALMDRVIPLCEQYDGFVLSVANEPQFYFEDFDADEDDFLNFYSEVTDHIHSLSNNVAVSITLANHELTSDLNTQMLGISDVISLNLYGVITNDPEDWITPIEQAEALVSPKQIIFQEMGLSSDSEGSTVSLQATYISTLSTKLQTSAQLRVLFWFLIHDPAEAFLDASTEGLEEAGLPDEFIVEVRLALSGLGMCTLTDNGCQLKQPTWDTFLDELDAIYSPVTQSSFSSGQSPYTFSQSPNTFSESSRGSSSSRSSGSSPNTDSSSRTSPAGALTPCALVSLVLALVAIV
eukprot:CAMPEP_0114628094 /NCGR_PEP_ID=MMETSP0168-20121206/12638_1 /TAXON_ID=95228 ORGANISM="Vannella sp., Strain DIVA3 517/6/12" /NCGR_SAMPLE_ID=MMETSP0168 /ASSEMBLY_ACC=CAM_ASM_000044 /LENGTH=413 /DNA_ID=CAMNT_0001839455 /DNA_START=1 /DNA_END=1242 /DNA_ORIENTATION=-